MLIDTKKYIEIFIGGSTDKNISKTYNDLARQLGEEINNRDYLIWFDGCDGIPRIIYDSLKNKKRSRIVYNDYYNNPKLDFGFIFSKKSQSEVTDFLIKNCDAIIFFKGGMGTLAEIAKSIDTKKNHEHDKPIVILNINHEWDELVNLLKTYDLDDLYYITDNVKDCLNYIENEIFKENSKYKRYYVDDGCSIRNTPIIK